VLAAADLVCWAKLICFTGVPSLARCEIATFRYRINAGSALGTSWVGARVSRSVICRGPHGRANNRRYGRAAPLRPLASSARILVNLRPEPALRRLTIGRRNRSARQGAPPR
jgi:hypothetical protein